MNNQNAEQTAEQNAKLKVEFRIHLATYIAVNALLTAINLILTPEYIWVIWPVLGWGVGLLVHAINVQTSTNSILKERMIEKELEKQKNQRNMNKVYFLISFLMLTAGIQAQQTYSPLSTGQQSEVSYSGFGGPLFLATGLNGELGFCIGGKGGAVLNESLVFGGLGFGMVHTLELTGNNMSDNLEAPLEMTFGAGGVFFEYIFNYGDRVEFSIPLNIMAGGIGIYESSTDTEVESSAMFILEPGINIDLNVSDYYTQSFFVSYRQAIGSSLVNLDDSNISGLNVGMIFKFKGK